MGHSFSIGGFGPSLAAPTLSPNSGSYTNSVIAQVANTTVGAASYYTTDGSVPTTASTLYTGPVTLTSSCTFTARSFFHGAASPTISAAYTINNIPILAVNAGYLVQTFNTTTIGTAAGNIIPFNFFGPAPTSPTNYVQNSDGSFTITGNTTGTNDFAAHLGTAAYDTSKQQNWRGTGFQNGMYIEMDCFYTGTQNGVNNTGSGTAVDWMWFLDAPGAATMPSPNKTVGFNGVEVDQWEMDIAGSTTQCANSVHNDYCVTAGTASSEQPTMYAGGANILTAPSGSYNVLNTYGMLWIPATGTTPGTYGSIQSSRNGSLIGTQAYWQKYNASQAYPPTGLLIGNVVDTQTLMLIMGCNATINALTVKGIRVWQASSADCIVHA